MRKKIIHYTGSILIIAVVGSIAFFGWMVYKGHSMKYNRNFAVQSNFNREGPFILYSDDSLVSVKYIYGDTIKGFHVEEKTIKTKSHISPSIYYFMDSTSFTVDINPSIEFTPEPSVYEMPEKIFAVSDIEGSYGAFRDLLIANKVIDKQLNWTFGKGHLVLNGDFVDRGSFVHQVLFLIYRLEQQAEDAGGKVHFILGNHEIMNMRGIHSSSAIKYWKTAEILNMELTQLYDAKHSFLGRWMQSKNTIEKIGNLIFTHGGLHPDLPKLGLDIDTMNRLIRKSYYTLYKPSNIPKNEKFKADLLYSSVKSPYWYRGYYNGDFSDAEMDAVLKFFDCEKIIVGHNIQNHIQKLFDGRVIGLDVEHPSETWRSYFPDIVSEGMLVMNGGFFRVDDEGKKIAL